MKAMVYTKYGPPDVLQLKEVEKPTPKDDDVLVKVKAVSVNSWDWDLLTGEAIIRLQGLTKPQYKILGSDIAGIVERVGRNVNRFKKGDEVFGDISQSGWGGFAEYACAREDALVLKSSSMTFKEAAAIPHAGLLALQGLGDKVQPGNKVLINGAGGGVGTFAIQLAKLDGGLVTGVDSLEKLELMQSLGADEVIDYKKEDFTKNGKKYDMILDSVGSRSIFAYKRSLSHRGNMVLIGGTISTLLQIAILGPLFSGNRKMGLLMHRPNKSLDKMIKHFEAGKVVPIIDRCYKLSEVPEAFRYFGKGRVKGKVVILMEHAAP